MAEADRHIAEGRERINKQIALVAELEHDGHDTRLAREFLDISEDTLQEHQQHREEILRKLEFCGKAREDSRGEVDRQQTLE